jgi:uncharacterized membrane protein
MKNFKYILTIFLGIFIAFSGIVHFLKPAFYLPFIPNFLPQMMINYMVGIAEMIVGVCVFIPRLRPVGTLGIFLMMFAFLPLHILDVFKDNPAIGTHQMALVRVPLQFVLIAWAWFIHKK